MSLVHESLSQNENIEKVDIIYYIEKIITFIKHIELNENIEYNLNIDKIDFSLETALPLGLILNELITNSFKHAFPNNMLGTINITIKKILEDNYSLLYSDNGVPFPKNTRKPNKLGLDLVNLLIMQIKGKIIFFNDDKKEISINFKSFE
jgi:two-component sensor histidine kinase